VSKHDPAASKRERNKTIRWVVTIFFVTILVSGIISFASDQLMSVSGILVACLILFAIILIGILFDTVGVAVTSADESPFHSMAARKVPGAQEAIKLLRNAERVSSICNDVIGDICGVVSGSASATIAAQVLAKTEFSWPQLMTLLMSALVAGFTVGGKAIGKTVAINSCTLIVHSVGKIIYRLYQIPKILHSKNIKR
jgi:CBS domain containing-hemolysin-like protein